MALTSLASVKLLLSITDASQDALVTACVDAAQAAVKNYIRRGKATQAFSSWPESGTDTEYYSGQDNAALVLRYYPVTSLASIYLDDDGYFGQGTDPFPSSTLLTAGSDYAIVLDDGAGSVSGRVLRLGGIGSGGTGGEYGWWPPGWGFTTPMGSLAMSGRRPAVWPAGKGNLKVTYTAGFTTIPSDLSYATAQLAVWLWRAAPHGGQTATSESFLDANYSLAAIQSVPDLGTIRQLLSKYRDVVF